LFVVARRGWSPSVWLDELFNRSQEAGETMTRLTGIMLDASAEVTITASANLNLDAMGGAPPISLAAHTPRTVTLGPGVFRVVSSDRDVVTVTVAAPTGKYVHISQQSKDGGGDSDPPKPGLERFGAAAVHAFLDLKGGRL
jgi:hypothetical protein